MIYLEVFLVRKLHEEICIGKKKVKISIFRGFSARMKCLKEFATIEPYAKRVKEAQLLHKVVWWMAALMIMLVVVYKLLGYGTKPESCSRAEEKVSVTVRKTEGNKTSVKIYKRLEDFLK